VSDIITDSIVILVHKEIQIPACGGDKPRLDKVIAGQFFIETTDAIVALDFFLRASRQFPHGASIMFLRRKVVTFSLCVVGHEALLHNAPVFTKSLLAW
jgi:hypothetical protein